MKFDILSILILISDHFFLKLKIKYFKKKNVRADGYLMQVAKPVINMDVTLKM